VVRGRIKQTTATLVVAAITFGLAACGEEEPANYTSAHRDAFLSACSRPLDDPRLLSDICVCVYDRLESEIPFARFVEISESLVVAEGDVGPVALPEPVAEIIADCFLVEADL